MTPRPDRADSPTSRPGKPRPDLPNGGSIGEGRSADDEGIRLQKILSQAGVASRRASEDMIDAGRVSVDGEVVTRQGVRVDPTKSVVHVDGLRIQLDDSQQYLLMNKPHGVITTMDDPEGRPCVGDLIASRSDRLFHVGRLDAETEGVLLLTTDGDLAHRLTHPSWEVPKTYLAQVAGPIAKGVGKRLRDGVELDDGKATVDSFRIVDSAPGRALIEVVLHEGRNRIVRRMLEEVGHPVQKLVRTNVGPIALGDLRPGSIRPLGRDEVGRLMAVVGM